ncbi:DUF5123 domain-containing protein [Geofilum sp. OHC36d9]|uniref:DUF5123 domain-containing protein n=1 Tax=Geofilum sp. OHC36d9 TaxID=3458413 RepID=UPI004034D8A0
MNNLFKIGLFWLLTISLSGALTSCDDDEELGSPDRLFRPVVNETSSGGTWIRAEWNRYQGAIEFNLQLSADSFVTILRDINVDTTFYQFDDLAYDTEYQMRIRSIGVELESEFFVNENIRTSDYPTKLMTPGAEDVIDNRARIKWSEVEYDSLVVFRNDTAVSTVVLTEEQNASKEAVITKLTPENSYVVRAYLDGEYMGKKSFTTVASQVFSGEVIDLREYSDEESLNLLSSDSIVAWSALYPAGFTVVLSGGTVYELTSTLAFSTNVHFVTGLSLNGFAVFSVKNNFDAEPDALIDSLKFEKIVFTDHPDAPRTASNFGSTYVFNFGQGGAVIDKISFESCDIRYKRGVLRAKTATTINSILMNNCFVDSIAGYGVLNFDNSAVVAGDIVITNSTFAYVEKFIVASKALSLNSLTLDQVTTYKVPKGTGNYFFDLDGKVVPGGVTISNSIFGAPESDSANGIRSDGANLTLNKAYRTSDLSWTTVDGTPSTAEKYPMDLENIGATSVETFVNPEVNDFTLIDKDLKGKVGDSRWW